MKLLPKDFFPSPAHIRWNCSSEIIPAKLTSFVAIGLILSTTYCYHLLLLHKDRHAIFKPRDQDGIKSRWIPYLGIMFPDWGSSMPGWLCAPVSSSICPVSEYFDKPINAWRHPYPESYKVLLESLGSGPVSLAHQNPPDLFSLSHTEHDRLERRINHRGNLPHKREPLTDTSSLTIIQNAFPNFDTDNPLRHHPRGHPHRTRQANTGFHRRRLGRRRSRRRCRRRDSTRCWRLRADLPRLTKQYVPCVPTTYALTINQLPSHLSSSFQ